MKADAGRMQVRREKEQRMLEAAGYSFAAVQDSGFWRAEYGWAWRWRLEGESVWRTRRLCKKMAVLAAGSRRDKLKQ